ncbi:MAG: hypothetical protein WC632_00165 [Candidatus Margulisiibacteriota bacterium]
MDSFNLAWSQLYPLLINVKIALVIVLVGYLLARGISLAVTYLLKLVQLDRWLNQVGFNSLLEKGEVRRSFSELCGNALYWLVIFITVIATAKWLGLMIGPALRGLLAYFSLVIIATMIMGFGLFFAALFAASIKLIMLNLGIDGGRTLARVVYYLVITVTFIVALAQLGVRADLPRMDVVIGAVGLAAAIAFGLGCKDMAADFLHNLFKGK